MIPMLEEIRIFQKVAEVLFLKDWAEASAGNMSFRLAPWSAGSGGYDPDHGCVQESEVDMTHLIGDRFLVTASGSRMREIAAEPQKFLCLIHVLDRRRYRLIEGAGPLSSEWPTHAGLHSLFKESRSPERAVLHCHPLNLISLSHIFSSEKEMNDRLFRMHHETRLFIPEMLGLIPYAVTGSMDLAKASREKLKKFRVAIWEKHGAIASGQTLDQALDRIEMVDKAAAIYLLVKSTGLDPEGLSERQLHATLRSAKK